MSNLPGDHLKVPTDTTCDTHKDRLAIAKRQGETDSFGAEYHHLCQECLDEFVIYKPSHCDWCESSKRILPYRDVEEGLNGPIYYLCSYCRKQELKHLT